MQNKDVRAVLLRVKRQIRFERRCKTYNRQFLQAGR